MNFKRTKVICTIGPATQSYSSLKKLKEAGMDVIRINMSHSDHKFAKKVIERTKKLNDTLSSPVGILLDTQGPEIRTGETSQIIDLKPGEKVAITVRDETDVESSSIHVNYEDLISKVNVGDLISVDNGLMNFEVLQKEEALLHCKVLHGGRLGSKRHVNIPGVRIDLPSLTKKDKEDILFGMKQDVDFIALSFVRSASDVEDLKDFLKSRLKKVKIISKIEDKEGLANLDLITRVSDGVMVARGDLGIETDLANLPNIQRKIMHRCAKWGRRSIVATHLLESMIDNPIPTRAEVTDVANAIYEGADAVMLSGETSIGNYPVECVEFISRIAKQTEKYNTLGYEKDLHLESDWHHLGVAAKNIAERIDADGIIAITRSGLTAQIVCNAKPSSMPVFSFTNNRKTLRQMSLSGSLINYYSAISTDHEKTVKRVLKILKNKLKPEKEMKFVLISGVMSENSADAIEIRSV
ncbi:MAG: pyruvate kinase [SAR86 cluster bacterium]|jgi:pyruvate kinase|nr:pyruvate kinase [SAR86 cluster bacterium]